LLLSLPRRLMLAMPFLIAFCARPGLAKGAEAPAAAVPESQGSAQLEFAFTIASELDVKREKSLCSAIAGLGQNETQPSAVCERTISLIAGPEGAEPRTNPTMLLPRGIAADRNGRVMVADPLGRAVHVFDFNRRKYSRIGGPDDFRLRSPRGIAVDDENNIYVVDSQAGMILVYNSRGKFQRYIGNIKGEKFCQRPSSIALDREGGHIYVADPPRHMIYRLNMEGEVLAQFGVRGGGNAPGQFNYPTAVAVSGGELIVLDANNRRIQVLDLMGNFRREFRGEFVSLHTLDLAVDGKGNMYITNPFLATIHVLSREGRLLYNFNGLAGGRGRLSSPTGIFVDSADQIYVADSTQHRVQVFRSPAGSRKPEKEQ
jgi:DNA-binding beta-propeller fold protein YncE